MRGQPNRAQISAEVSLPAPVGGWNARDALAAMPVTDAETLDNLFPRPDRIDSRGGSSIWATGMTGNVDTVMEWRGPSSAKMLSVDSTGHLYDTSTAGAVGAAIVAGLSSTPFQSAMFTTPGGSFLVFANGVDPVQNYDGAALTVPTITGVTASTLFSPNVYAGRLFFPVKNTLKVAYLPLNSIAGAAGVLDFGSLCKRGGFMVAMGTWTADGGDGGSDDLAVFMTSEGEVLIYTGTDPTTAGSFQKVGIFQCGKPLGKRPLLKYGADLVMILEDGTYPVSSLIKQGVTQASLALSDKIRVAFGDAAKSFGSVFGWQATYYPLLQRMIVNVPQNTTGTTYVQFVMSSLTQSWCRYRSWNARSWVQFNSLPYFGDASGRVWKAETGGTDNAVPITVSCRQAYSNLGVPGRTKHVLMARPRLQVTTIRSNIILDADIDYQNNPVVSVAPLSFPIGMWDVSLWNACYWSVGQRTLGDWQTLGVVGTVIAPRFAAQLNGPMSWFGTDLVAEPGAIL